MGSVLSISISFLRSFLLGCRWCVFGLRWGDFVGAALLVEAGFKGFVECFKRVSAASLLGSGKVVFVGAPPPSVAFVGDCCLEALALGVDEGGRGLAVLFKGGGVVGIRKFGLIECGSAGLISLITGASPSSRIASFTKSVESAVTMFPPPPPLMRDLRFVGLSALAEDMSWRGRASEGLRGVEHVLEVFRRVGERVVRAWEHVVRVEASVSVEGVKGYVVVGDDGSKLVTGEWEARPARYGAAVITQELLEEPSTAYVTVILEEGGIAKAATAVAGPAARHTSRKLAATIEELNPGIPRLGRRAPSKSILTAPHHPPNIKLGLPKETAVKIALKAMKTLMQRGAGR